MEDFKRRHRLDLPAVPYRSTPQSLTAVIAGEVPIVLDSLGAELRPCRRRLGCARSLSPSATGRSACRRCRRCWRPASTEREWVAWYAFMAPKGTPPEAIQRLNEVINQALQEAPIVARFRELGGAPRITTPAETLAFIRAEKADFGTIARAGKIRVE